VILLRNGTIVDGTGSAPITGDVLIDGERIASTGAFKAPAGCQVVDCTGLTIAPGFIDLHSHSDLQVLTGERAKSDQGVTTEVVGNCGFSPYPCGNHLPLLHEFANGIFCGDDSWGWPQAKDYLRDVSARASLVGVASLVGHGSLRIAHMGMNQAPPSSKELDAMEGSLDEALSDGAAGFSTGLMYAPGSSAPREELVALCKVVARRDRLYATHMRSYSFDLLSSLDEQIDLARASGCRLQISHMQTVGQKNWHLQPQAIERIEAARAEGIDIEYDSYPYVAGSTVATQLLPQWALDGGAPKMLSRLRDPEQRQRVQEQALSTLAQRTCDIYIVAVASQENAAAVGCHLDQIAEWRGKPPIEALVDLILEEEGRVNILSFNQSEDNLRVLMQHPLGSVISDGFYVKGRPHPRLYGTFPFLIGEVCRERRWIPLETAIHKITAKPAARLKLKDRGTLEPGKRADVTIFDFATIAGRATYEAPRTSPVGIARVYRDGKLMMGEN